MLAKSFSVIFSVSGGLFAGPDGPMVHVGASLGAMFARLYSKMRPYDGTSLNAISRDFATYGIAGILLFMNVQTMINRYKQM